MAKKWMQEATSEETEGDFTAWCRRHGHDGVNQACINEAAREGGRPARMALFAVNTNPDKWYYPKSKGRAEQAARESS